jgi:hypothetical protein
VLWAAYDRLIPHMRSICPAMVSSVTLVHSPALWLGLRREWSIVSGPGTYSTYTPSIQVSCFIQLWRSTRLTVMSAGRFTKLPRPPKRSRLSCMRLRLRNPSSWPRVGVSFHAAKNVATTKRDLDNES